MVMAFGDNGSEISNGIESDEIHVIRSLQNSPNGVVYIEVTTFEDAVRVIEFPMYDQ